MKIYNISKVLFIIIALSFFIACNGDCTNTKVIFKIVGYSTDMCPIPGGNCTINGDFNVEFHNGDGMGQEWFNGKYVSIPFSIEDTGDGWTYGGSFEITQEGYCIGADGSSNGYYRCSSGKINVPAIPCNKQRIINVYMFCTCN